MAKYDITHSCGHTVTHQIFGRHDDRERKIKWLEDRPCTDCWRREREEEQAKQNAESAQKNAEAGLPALQGSEKQVAWAETIRAKIIADTGEKINDTIPGKTYGGMAWAITRIPSASWWIEHRDGWNFCMDRAMLVGLQKAIALAAGIKPEDVEEIRKWVESASAEMMGKLFLDMWGITPTETAPMEEPSTEEEEVMSEATVRPSEPVTETVAEFARNGDEIIIRFPEKRNDFWETVKKELGYSWKSGAWHRKITKYSGPVEDRMAEAGNRLMSQGFIIRILDGDIRQKALNGDFAPERKNWIKAMVGGRYKDWFGIRWGRDYDYYEAARKIKASKWYSESRIVVVPKEQFEEVFDFADTYEFSVSEAALALAEKAEKLKLKALHVDPVVPEEPEPVEFHGKPQKLKVPESVEIDESLRDDD